MARNGKAIPAGLVWVVAIALIALVGLGSYAIFMQPTPQSGLVGGTGALTPTEQQQALAMCGSDKQTTVSLTFRNALNTTAAETIDASYVIYQVQSDGRETQVASGSDTTAGTQTLDCGQQYRLKLLGGGAVNARVVSVYTQNAQVAADGSVVFTTTAPTLTLGFSGSKHSMMKGQLNADEAKRFADYEYVFLIPAGRAIDGRNSKLYFDILKSTGASGSDTLKVDFAVRSNYLSVDGFTVKTAGATDASTNPTVRPLFETSFLTQ
jgi:hypothetical protein